MSSYMVGADARTCSRPNIVARCAPIGLAMFVFSAIHGGAASDGSRALAAIAPGQEGRRAGHDKPARDRGDRASGVDARVVDPPSGDVDAERVADPPSALRIGARTPEGVFLVYDALMPPGQGGSSTHLLA